MTNKYLRAEKIVERMEQEVKLLRGDLADMEDQMVKAGNNRRWYEIGELSEKYRKTADQVSVLELWLSIT